MKVSIDVKLLQLDTIDIYSEYKRVMPQLSCISRVYGWTVLADLGT